MSNELLVHIEKLSFGGAGIGRVAGKVCFVPFTAVGDVARVRVTTEKKSFFEGELLSLVEPSPERKHPPCGVFGACGGCSWQHLPYDMQLKAKEDIFAEILWRSARVAPERILPALPAPAPFCYRSRVQFKIRCIAGQLHIGFYRQGSHYVVDLPGRCEIACEAVNVIVAGLREILKEFPEPDKIPQLDIATGDSGEAHVLLHYIGEQREQVAGWLRQALPGMVPVTGIFLQCGRKATIGRVWGEDRLSYTFPADLVTGFPGMKLSFRAGGFSQVNYRQNLALVKAAIQMLDLKGTEQVLDLFCGNGNFSLPIAHFSAAVVGIEEFGQSIEDAEWNALQNGITNARFLCREAKTGVRELVAGDERFDIAVLDPPRAGAREVIRPLVDLHPDKILYISCDPATLARDIASLAKAGYEVVACRAVDMFPQTYHIESVTLLQK